MYRVGLACVDITPPVGYLLQGHSKRNQPSRRVHDPLFLKAMSIAEGDERVVMITSDLVYFAPAHVAAIKAEINRRTGLPAERVMITAAHTHTGPFMFTSLPDDERLLPDYISLLTRKIVGAVLEAVDGEVPALLRWGTGEVDIGIMNRRRKDASGRVQMDPNPDRPVDPCLTVLAACAPHGGLRALLCNYTCHPTVLGTDIYEISGDYPGAFQNALQRMYPGALAMFANGCCGDVRPAIIDPATGLFKGGTFADTERMGRILACEAAQVFERTEEIPSGAVCGRLRSFDLPLEETLLPSSLERLESAFLRHQQSLTEHDGAALEKWRACWAARLAEGQPVPRAVPIDLQALHVGPARLVGIAGETMLEIGLRIRKAAAGCKLMLCGDANGVVGYLPTAEAVGEGGYETNSFIHKFYAAPYSAGMEDVLVNSILSLI